MTDVMHPWCAGESLLAIVDLRRIVISGLCPLDRLFGGVGLCRISHGSSVTVCGVIGRNLQPLGGGSSLQHGIFGDLLISFLGLPILGFGSETDVSITPTFCGG